MLRGERKTLRMLAQHCADLALGGDGFTVNMPANGHVSGRVELLGSTLAPLTGSGR